MPFSPREWKDFPDHTTPITAAALIEMEERLAAYTDAFASRETSTDKTLAFWKSTATAPTLPLLLTETKGAADKSFQTQITGDTIKRFTLLTSGKLEWGPGGSTSRDTNLYRGGVHLLKTDSELELALNKRIILSADDDGVNFSNETGDPTHKGGISELLLFKTTGDFARPWMAWRDESERLRAAMGWHYKEVTGETVHNRLETKTSVAQTEEAGYDPKSPIDAVNNKNYEATRLAIGTDKPRVEVIFNFLNEFQLGTGYFTEEGVPLKWTMPTELTQEAPSRVWGSINTKGNSSGNSFLDLDSYSVDSTHLGAIRMFRNVNTGGNVEFNIKPGDGTNTDMLRFLPKTGELDLRGFLVFKDPTTGNEVVDVKPTFDGSGHTVIEWNSKVSAETKNITERRFNKVKTSGVVKWVLQKPDESETEMVTLNAGEGSATLRGPLFLKDPAAGAQVLKLSGEVEGSGHTISKINLSPASGKNATLRLFRDDNTSGSKKVIFFNGKGENVETIVLDAGGSAIEVRNAGGELKKVVLTDDSRLRLVSPAAYPEDSGASTMSRLQASANLAMTAGTMWSARARCRVAGTYTKVRICTGNVTPNLTDMRVGVNKISNGEVIQQSADIHASVTAQNEKYDLALGEGVTLVDGEEVWLSVAFKGTALTLKGMGNAAGMGNIAPILTLSTAGWAGAETLPKASGTATQNVLWLELAP